MREIIFDTETTGLDPRTGDRMVEIGCIEMVNRVSTGRTFHSYFNPDRDMPAAAEAVHGLSVGFLSDKPRFIERAGDLLEFIEDSQLVAHNAGFDFGFLNNELEICGLEPVYSGAGPGPASRCEALARCALHPLRHRSQPPHPAWRFA
jgi:DNA polymerase III subunit epsilon